MQTIKHARDAQRPEFVVGLRYKHASDWLWSVSLLPERKRQSSQRPLDPDVVGVRRLEVRHQIGAVENAITEIAGQRSQPGPAEIAHRVRKRAPPSRWGAVWDSIRKPSKNSEFRMPQADIPSATSLELNA